MISKHTLEPGTADQTPDEKHFSLIYWYILMVSLFVLAYVLLITFLPIPEKNQRFVDITLAFLLGFISSNSQYLTGGSPLSKKNEGPIIQQTGDRPVATAGNNEKKEF